HGDMETYFAAKSRMFRMRKPGAPAVVNADDPWGQRLAREIEPPVWTFSAGGNRSEVRATAIDSTLTHTAFDVVAGEKTFRIESPLLGRFQVENLLAAAAAGLALDVPETDITSALGSVERVPGRLDPVPTNLSFPILVDYAHTPDALERLLA